MTVMTQAKLKKLPQEVQEAIVTYSRWHKYDTLTDSAGNVVTPGMRIRCRWTSYYLNTFVDEGYVLAVDMYGGVHVMFDNEHNYHNREGFITGKGRIKYGSLEGRTLYFDGLAGDKTYTLILEKGANPLPEAKPRVGW